MRRDLERQASRSTRWSVGFWAVFFAALAVHRIGPDLFGVGPSLDALFARVMAAAGLAAVNCLFIAVAMRAFGRSLVRQPAYRNLLTAPPARRRAFR